MAVAKETVKNSMECKALKKGTKYGFIGLVIVELIMFICIIAQAEDVWTGLMQVVGVFLLVNTFMAIPFTIYFAMYWNIVRKHERYDVYEVRLDNPKRCYIGRGGPAYYYIVTFTNKNNEVVKARTRALWSNAAFAVYSKRDYDKKKVKILYDENSAKVVVLGKV
ncbi:MAG: hypothetical protein IJW18_05380 [Lachnospiraceae bacterium]|nr:hypothetical protein [Lachnospiraceae bacterium]